MDRFHAGGSRMSYNFIILRIIRIGGRGFALIRFPAGMPSFLSSLFEAHWLLWLTLLGVSAALFWRGGIQSNRRMRLAGAIVFALGLLWMLSAWAVVTPRERLRNAVTSIVRAATRNDVARMIHFVAPHTLFDGWNRRRMKQQLRLRLAAAHITGNLIRLLKIRIKGRKAQTQLVVWTQTRNRGPFTTAWRLSWRDHSRPGNWRIVRVRLLRLNGQRLPPGAVPPMAY
jgi:hypothetical protein